MGNAAMVCAGRGDRDAVTVLRADGKVLSFYSRVAVVDLILDHPNHFVCRLLMPKQQAKILPMHTVLEPGEVYLLLPIPCNSHGGGDSEVEERAEDYSDSSSLLHREPPRQAVQGTVSMKFVISTEQFTKIMSGSIKEGRLKKSKGQGTAKKRNRSRSKEASMKGPHTHWRPALSSIQEVAAN